MAGPHPSERRLRAVGIAHEPAELPRLLLSIRDIFAAKQVERMTTKELCARSTARRKSGWSEMNHGRGINDYWLREILSRRHPQQPGLGEETALARRRQEAAGATPARILRTPSKDTFPAEVLPKPRSHPAHPARAKKNADGSETSTDRMGRAGSKNAESRSGPSGPGRRERTDRMGRMQNGRDPYPARVIRPRKWSIHRDG